MNKKLPNPLPENTPGQRILKLRLGAGLTLEQLAERLDFTANYFGPHACGTAENLESLSENQASLAAFIKNCSEEECRMPKPIIKVFTIIFQCVLFTGTVTTGLIITTISLHAGFQLRFSHTQPSGSFLNGQDSFPNQINDDLQFPLFAALLPAFLPALRFKHLHRFGLIILCDTHLLHLRPVSHQEWSDLIFLRHFIQCPVYCVLNPHIIFVFTYPVDQPRILG